MKPGPPLSHLVVVAFLYLLLSSLPARKSIELHSANLSSGRPKPVLCGEIHTVAPTGHPVQKATCILLVLFFLVIARASSTASCSRFGLRVAWDASSVVCYEVLLETLFTHFCFVFWFNVRPVSYCSVCCLCAGS